MLTILHHLRLIFSHRPEETGKWRQDAWLTNGEITSVVAREGRVWTLWGGRRVTSDQIRCFYDAGDYGY